MCKRCARGALRVLFRVSYPVDRPEHVRLPKSQRRAAASVDVPVGQAPFDKRYPVKRWGRGGSARPPSGPSDGSTAADGSTAVDGSTAADGFTACAPAGTRTEALSGGSDDLDTK